MCGVTTGVLAIVHDVHDRRVVFCGLHLLFRRAVIIPTVSAPVITSAKLLLQLSIAYIAIWALIKQDAIKHWAIELTDTTERRLRT